MKKITNNIVYIILISCISISCSKNEDLMYNTNKSYVYFSLPFKKDNYGRDLKERVDSLNYSFALEGDKVVNHTFKVPINIAGLSTDSDRNVKVQIIEEETTATSSEWDKTVVNNAKITKGRVFDTLLIKVNRTPALKNINKTIKLRILPNNNFVLGDTIHTTAKITFSDILLEPKYWATWNHILGDFCPEVYLKWKEIYKEGLDPKGYNWNKMPGSAYSSWYPVTFLYLSILRDYFLNNEVFPYGDSTKKRIKINL